MSNPFDQFDQKGNPFDQFDTQSKPALPADNGSPLAGALEGAAHIGESAVTAPFQGLAGIAGLVKGALDPNDTAANASQRYMEATQQALTKPIATVGTPEAQQGLQTQAANQAMQQAAATLSNAPAAMADQGITKAQQVINAGIKDAGLSKSVDKLIQDHPALLKVEPALRAITQTAVNAAPIAGAAFGAMDTPVTPESSPFARANAAGYKIVPSEADLAGGSSTAGKVVEGIANATKTATDAAIKNSNVTSSLAAQELADTAPDLGITKNTELTPEIIDKARSVNNGPYRDIENLSSQYGRIPADADYIKALDDLSEQNQSSFGANPDIEAAIDRVNKPDFTSAELLKEVKSLRKNSTGNYKIYEAYNTKNAYDLQDLAQAQSSLADILEDRLDRFAQQIPGQEDLVSRFQQARQNLAKINAIDNSIKAGTTTVSPTYFGRQLNNGAPLTGNLKFIGEMANNFPKSIRDVSTIANKTPYGRFDLFGTMGGVELARLGHPGTAMATLGAFVAPPLARSALLSGSYQGAMLPGSSALTGMLPGAAMQSGLTGQQLLAQQLMQGNH